MSIFDKLKEKFNKVFEIKKEGRCIRCNKASLVDIQGYCEKCSVLKTMIHKQVALFQQFGNQSKEANDLYNVIKIETKYQKFLLDVDNAETIDTLSGIEKEFLSYVNSKSANGFELAGYWTYQHFIDCNYLISKFIKNGYLEISKNKNIESMSADELKTILKKVNLKVSGSKAELIKRIKENLTKEQIEQFNDNEKEFFVLTNKGKDLLQGDSPIIAKDGDFEKECYALILDNKLNEAYKLVANYENNKLIKRGIGCDWSNVEAKTFYLYVDSELPFKLPQCLVEYEKELKAAAIYTQMMGANPMSAVSFFCKNNEIDFDKSIINKIIPAIYSIAQGIAIPSNIINELENIDVKNTNRNNNKQLSNELSIDEFIKHLKDKIKNAGYNLHQLKYDIHKDGTYNFIYKDFQIGRVKFGKRSSKMQILNGDSVLWLENEDMETYIVKMDLWIDYIKSIEF